MNKNEAAARRSMSRRSLLAGLAVLPMGLAGCRFLTSEPGPQTVAAEPGAFPVVVTHAFGETSVKNEPKRVVALDLASADHCVALGLLPIAVPLTKSTANGSTPWLDYRLLKFGASLPQTLDFSKQSPQDQLGALNPDLILASDFNLSQSEYDELSKIAPVIARPAALADVSWQSALDVAGRALGRSALAKQLTQETNRSYLDQLGNYPDLAGTTAIVAAASIAPGADFEVFGSRSNAMRVLTEFGLRPAGALQRVQAEGKQIGTPETGPEAYRWPQTRAAELDSAVMVISVAKDASGEITGSGILNGIPAYAAKSSVFVDSAENGLALATASALAVQWLARSLLPELAKVAYNAKSRS
jgi:iron complex transport system substrate-binding protein